MFDLVQSSPPACLPHADMVAVLARGHDEHPAGAGAAAGNVAFILFVSRDSATWTLVIRRGQVSCIAASGADWSALGPPPPAERGI